MKSSTIAATATLLFFAATLPTYAQRDEKGNDKQQPQHTQQAAPQARPAQQPERAPQSRPAQQAQQPRQQSSQQSPQQTRPQQAQAAEQQQSKPSPVRNSEQRPAAQQAARTPQAQHAPSVAEHVQPQRPPAVTAHAQAPQVQRSSSQVQSWQQQRGWAKQGGWQPHTSFQQGRDQNWSSDHRDWAQRGGYGGAYIPQVSFGVYFGSAHFFHIGPMPVMYMGYPRFAYGGYSFMVLDPWPGSWQENWYASDDVYIDYSDGYYLHDRRYPGVSLAVSVVL